MRPKCFHPAAVAALVLAIDACSTSPPPNRYPPALVPNGVEGTISVADGRAFDIELLEVTDTAYVVLIDHRVAVAPYRALTAVYLAHQDWVHRWSQTWPSAEARDRLRLASRFPQGMPPAALVDLLRRAGQDRPDNLAMPR